jgi:hypothetical protein
MLAKFYAPGAVRRLATESRVDSAARGRLTCRWSRDPATGKRIATWSRESDPRPMWDRLEPEPTRLRTRALRPGAFASQGERLAA